MKNLLFAKYNRTRQEDFQISTCIYEDETRYYVEKKALNKNALLHIHNFQKNYEILSKVDLNLRFLEPTVLEDKSVFAFIKGETLTTSLVQYLSDIDLLISNIKTAILKIFSYKDSEIIDFVHTKEFEEVFGSIENKSFRSLKVSNIDTIFDNIMIQNDEYYCLDYEWVFQFPIPMDYCVYRSLLFFYLAYGPYISMTQEEFLEKFDFDKETQEMFWSLEDHFQQYVFGTGRRHIYTNNYRKKVTPFKNFVFEKENNDVLIVQKDEHIKNLEHVIAENAIHINNLQEQVQLSNDHIKSLEEYIAVEMNLKDNHIRNLEETMRLKDNHINNLEELVGNLRNECEKKDLHIQQIHRAIKNPFYGVYLLIQKLRNKRTR
jgi:hypothetical protein